MAKFNIQFLVGRQVWKNTGAIGSYDIVSVKKIESDNIKVTISKGSFSMTESFTEKELLDLSKGKTVKDTELLKETKMEKGGTISLTEYYIFEGYDHKNSKPLYKVSSKVNEYDGEWHTNKKDAQLELKGLSNNSISNLGYSIGGL